MHKTMRIPGSVIPDMQMQRRPPVFSQDDPRDMQGKRRICLLFSGLFPSTDSLHYDHATYIPMDSSNILSQQNLSVPSKLNVP